MPRAVRPTLGPVDGGARFDCALCGQQAGTIRLGLRHGELWAYRESFTSNMECRVSPDAAVRLRSALAVADARAVYEIDIELASFYCPNCSASYCGEHWRRWDVFDD